MGLRGPHGPAWRVAWRTDVYDLVRGRAQRQGELSVAQMCTLLGVSRAGYYRHWRLSRSRDRDLQGLECTPSGVRAAPAEEETALRDRLQQLALAHRHYGYRRLGPLLRHEGWAVNHKRVLRLMREDNLLCLRRKSFVPATTDSRHGWRIWPNLARHLVPSAIDQLPRASC